MTGGEVMAEPRRVEGAHIFGLGGSEEVGFSTPSSIVPLSLRSGLHEGSVMSMADGYARASEKRPGQSPSIAGAGYAFGRW
jgi:thiamine pyrophosphate-dependent acetolactate synthase large subunit-like protein